MSTDRRTFPVEVVASRTEEGSAKTMMLALPREEGAGRVNGFAGSEDGLPGRGLHRGLARIGDSPPVQLLPERPLDDLLDLLGGDRGTSSFFSVASCASPSPAPPWPAEAPPRALHPSAPCPDRARALSGPTARPAAARPRRRRSGDRASAPAPAGRRARPSARCAPGTGSPDNPAPGPGSARCPAATAARRGSPSSRSRSRR